MRITAYDRLQGLIRSGKYRKDYEAYKQEGGEDYHILHGTPETLPISLSEPAKRLCRKWGLRFPVNPCERARPGDEEYVFPILSFLPSPQTWWEEKSFTWTGEQDERQIERIDGKLALLIDTSYPVKTIVDRFKDFLELHLIEAGKHTGERTREDEDVWQIYDKNTLEKKDFVTIIREVYDIKRKVIEDDRAKAYYDKTRRAFGKAEKIIETMEKRAESIPELHTP